MRLKKQKTKSFRSSVASGRANLLAPVFGRKKKAWIIHLDKFTGKPNWVETTLTRGSDGLKKLGREAIMDGNYEASGDGLEKWDTVIFLDLPRALALPIIKRLAFHAPARARYDEGCDERSTGNILNLSKDWNHPSRSNRKSKRC